MGKGATRPKVEPPLFSLCICANLEAMSNEMTTKKDGEKIYEVGYHLLSSIAEEQISTEVEKVKATLAKEKAIILAEESPKLIPLAYEIKKAFSGVYKKFDKAYFGFIKFELSETGDVTKIDAALKNNENILRYIIVKTVRENTMYSPKISTYKGELKSKGAKLEKPAEKSASVEEIDQSIEEFVKKEVEV